MGSGVKHATLGNGTKVTDTVWAEDHAVTNVLPDTDATYDLGSTTVKWNNAWVLALRKLANIYPGTSEKFYINASDETPRAIWENLHQTSFTLKPNTNDTGTLGTSARNWDDAYVKSLHAEFGIGYHATMLYSNSGVSLNPGDTDWHNIDSTRMYIPANYIKPVYAKLSARVQADEAGQSSIGINHSGGGIAGQSWTGTTATTLSDPFASWVYSSDVEAYVNYKASSATETITVWNVTLELRSA